MRNALIGLVSAMSLASAVATGGCADYSGGSGTGGTAGTAGTAGTTGTGGAASTTGGSSSTGGGQKSTGGSGTATGGGSSCPNIVTPCGGDVVGTWSVTSSCLNVSGNVNMVPADLGCSTASITTESLQVQVSGTWIANADGSYTDNTTTTGTAQLELPASCLQVSGTTTTCTRAGSALQSIGYATGSCSDNTATGGCTCTATVNQPGGIGAIDTNASTGDSYTTSGNTITISDGRNGTPYAYCVSGTTLTLSPQTTTTSSAVTTTGTIVLQKQ